MTRSLIYRTIRSIKLTYMKNLNSPEAVSQEADLALNKKQYKFNSILKGVALAVSVAIGATYTYTKNVQEKNVMENASRVQDLEALIGKPCDKDRQATFQEKLGYKNKVETYYLGRHEVMKELMMRGFFVNDAKTEDLDKSPVFCQVLNMPNYNSSYTSDRSKIDVEGNLLLEYLNLKSQESNLKNPLWVSLFAEALVIGLYFRIRRKTKQSDWAFLRSQLQKIIKGNDKDGVETKMQELKKIREAIDLLIAREEQLESDVYSAVTPDTSYRQPVEVEQENRAKQIRLAVEEGNVDKALRIYKGEEEVAEIEDEAHVEESAQKSQIIPGGLSSKEKY